MKFKTFLLTVLLMIFTVTVTSLAEENYFRENALIFEIIEDEFEEQPVVMLFADIPIEDYLAEQFANHTEVIDISQYNITLNEISVILSEHYEYMVASGKFSFSIISGDENASNPRITDIRPYYLFANPKDDAEGRKFIEDSVKEYADYARNNTDDPVEQLLLVHDRILKNTRYDFNYNTLSYSAYGLFKNNTCVCQGYSEAIYLISKELGIDAGFCSYFFKKSNGNFEGHIWNYIKIDNQWYQLDATWDEPTYIYTDVDGNVQNAEYENAGHSYFLVSDDIIEAEHYSKDIWVVSLDEKPVCDNAKYETNHFFNIKHLCYITYGDGYLQTTFTVNPIGDIVLRTYDGLYTGPIISSTVTETSGDYALYYYFLEEFKKFDVVVSAKDNGKLLTAKCYSKIPPSGTYMQYSFGGINVPKTDFPQKQGLELFTWNQDTLRPLSSKVQLN